MSVHAPRARDGRSDPKLSLVSPRMNEFQATCCYLLPPPVVRSEKKQAYEREESLFKRLPSFFLQRPPPPPRRPRHSYPLSGHSGFGKKKKKRGGKDLGTCLGAAE